MKLWCGNAAPRSSGDGQTAIASSAALIAGQGSLGEHAELCFLDADGSAGEVVTLLPYKEFAADYLLVDDACGRKAAKINRIKTTGSIGVPRQARCAGLIPAVEPLPNRIAHSPVIMSKNLLKTVLASADELGLNAPDLLFCL